MADRDETFAGDDPFAIIRRWMGEAEARVAAERAAFSMRAQ